MELFDLQYKDDNIYKTCEKERRREKREGGGGGINKMF